MYRHRKILKNFTARIQAALPEHAQGKTVELWFQDEARIGQKSTLTRIWAKTGTRPRMKRDQRYTCAYIFGAVCPARDIGGAVIVPSVNTEAMNAHLKEISQLVAKEAHAVVVIDGAGWHKSKNLTIPDNLTLLPLPPYSPELNAQENIWQYLRQNYLAGRVFETYQDIVSASCKAWNALINETGRISSIASRQWFTING